MCNYTQSAVRPFATHEGPFLTTGPEKPVSDEDRIANTKTAAAEFKLAADDLEKFLSLDPAPEDAEMWRQQLKALRVHSQHSTSANAQPAVISVWETTTKPKVLDKPAPSYTASAKSARLEGTVILRAVLSAEGTVRDILVLNALPNGLTQKTVSAAQKIKFVPATKDGKRVSVVMMLEYNFNLY